MVCKNIDSTLAAKINALRGNLLATKQPGLPPPNDVLALPVNPEGTNNVVGNLDFRPGHGLLCYRADGAKRERAFGDTEKRGIGAVVLNGGGNLCVDGGIWSRPGCGLETPRHNPLGNLAVVERLFRFSENRDDCVFPRLFRHKCV